MRNCVMIGATHALDSCISRLTPPPPVIYMWSRRQSFSFSKSTSSRPLVIYFRSRSYSFMWLAPFSTLRVDRWVVSSNWIIFGCLLAQLGVAPSGERLRRKGRHGVFAGKTVWSMPERFEIIHSIEMALYEYSSFPFLNYVGTCCLLWTTE